MYILHVYIACILDIENIVVLEESAFRKRSPTKRRGPLYVCRYKTIRVAAPCGGRSGGWWYTFFMYKERFSVRPHVEDDDHEHPRLRTNEQQEKHVKSATKMWILCASQAGSQMTTSFSELCRRDSAAWTGPQTVSLSKFCQWSVGPEGPLPKLCSPNRGPNDLVIQARPERGPERPRYPSSV